MFNGCSSLEEINFTNFDISNVNNMESMFDECNQLKTLDLPNFYSSNVINMGIMFIIL